MVIVLLTGTIFEVNAQGLTLRVIPKIGTTLIHPSIEDLDYGEGYRKENFSIANLGLTAQILKNFNNVKFGAEFGLQSLWSAEISAEQEDWSYIQESRWNEKRSDIHILGIVELPMRNNIILQGGIGIHSVFYEATYTYLSDYIKDGSEDEEYSGAGIALGMMVSGGVNLPVSENISIPILARLDMITYEGLMMPLSLMVGLSFNL